MKICCFLLLPVFLLSQNLVVNTGFETLEINAKLKNCTYSKQPEDFNNALKGWTTIALATPDVVLQPDSSINCYFPKPHGGNIFVGFINYLPQADAGYDYDYHEYLQGTLSKPLQPGKTYQIEFWIYYHDSLAIHHINWLYRRHSPDMLPLATNNIGFYFSEKPLVMANRSSQLKPQFNVNEIIAEPAGVWQRVSGTFVADKFYKYFTIGNFFTDDETKVNKPEAAARVPALKMQDGKFVRRIWRIAYYLIDDVSITLADKVAPITIETTQPYTFQNVQFATGGWDLLPGAEAELAALAEFIRQNSDKRFEIAGYTDDVGNAEANQILSEKRAKTVYDHLLQNGVNAKQLMYKGYGESNPLADNGTPEGRQQNRRVECKKVNDDGE